MKYIWYTWFLAGPPCDTISGEPHTDIRWDSYAEYKTGWDDTSEGSKSARRGIHTYSIGVWRMRRRITTVSLCCLIPWFFSGLLLQFLLLKLFWGSFLFAVFYHFLFLGFTLFSDFPWISCYGVYDTFRTRFRPHVFTFVGLSSGVRFQAELPVSFSYKSPPLCVYTIVYVLTGRWTWLELSCVTTSIS